MFFLLGLYLYLDPYQVIHEYDSFFENNANAYIPINQDYVSTSTFDSNCKTIKMNSFIFGNSRSLFYQVSDWKKHIGQENNTFHFDASGESLYALHKKVAYINKKKMKIDHVLLIVDESLLSRDNPQPGILFEISPQLVNNDNFFHFHFQYVKAYFSSIVPLTYFKVTNKVPFPSSIFNYKFDNRKRFYDPTSNEMQFKIVEKMIDEGKYYTKEKMNLFYRRDTIQKYSKQTILSKQEVMLEEIFTVFTEHNTKYKIIINPLYNQIKINQKDLKYLKELFGKEHVFDFSGINNYTKDYQNYYETSHYRPHISRKILKEIYKNN